MTSSHDDLEQATALLSANLDNDVPSAPADVAQRQLLALEAALALRGSKRGRPWWPIATALSAAAAAAAAVYVARDSMHGTRIEVAAKAPVAPASDLFEGRAVRTGSESLPLRDETGTALLVQPDSEMQVVKIGAERIFRLQHGDLDAHVAKLTPGARFLVRTDDTEIEVRGTRFRVHTSDMTECDGGHTRVMVEEGVVSVRRAGVEVRVAADEVFPRCNATTTATAARGVSADAPPHTAAVATGHSLLARQNDLFADAMSAKARGDMSQAESSLSRLIQIAPEGPLVENAYAQKFAIQAGRDVQAAKATARLYLQKFPQGFARSRAHELLGSLP